MGQKLVPGRIITLLAAGGIILPIGICVTLGAAQLLSAMGDVAGGAVLGWIALGVGIFWVIDLLCLLLALGLAYLGNDDERSQ
jgi:hypothetical protein